MYRLSKNISGIKQIFNPYRQIINFVRQLFVFTSDVTYKNLDTVSIRNFSSMQMNVQSMSMPIFKTLPLVTTRKLQGRRQNFLTNPRTQHSSTSNSAYPCVQTHVWVLMGSDSNLYYNKSNIKVHNNENTLAKSSEQFSLLSLHDKKRNLLSNLNIAIPVVVQEESCRPPPIQQTQV